MKIYKHQYDRYDKRIATKEIEVEEKPKSYVGIKGSCKCRILKTDIDKIKGDYYTEMFTLSPDPSPYINALIKKNQARINTWMNNVKELTNINENLLSLLTTSEVQENE